MAKTKFRFFKQTYLAALVLVAAVIFFFGYNTYLVDRSLVNLRATLGRISDAKTLADAKRFASDLDYSLTTEMNSRRVNISNIAQIEFAQDVLNRTQDIDQLKNVKLVLQEVIKHKERTGFLDALDRVNQIFEPISSKLTKGQLEGQLTRLLEKVPALKDKQQLQALYFEAGDLCMKLEDSTKAVEYYTQVVQMDPESDLARRSRFNMAWNNKRQGRLNEALKEFELLSKIKGQEKLDVLCYYQIADISALKGDYRSAADAYQKIAVEEEATDKNLASFSYFKAGYSYLYDLGEYDKAKELFNKSETVSKGSSFSAKVESEVIPQISTEYFNNGFNLLEEGYLKSAPDYYRRALGCFDKALEISENSQIYAGKSLAYLWLNDPGNTLLFARKAAKLFSKDEFACVNLGYIYIQLGMIEDAIKEYKRFISSNRNSAKAYYNLGYAYIMQNKLEDAVSSFTRAVKIDPQLGKAFNNRGLCFWRLGRYAEAIQSFQQAVTVNPDLADAFYNLGIIYKSMGKYDESFQELSAALKLKPGSIEIKRQLDEVMLFQSARN